MASGAISPSSPRARGSSRPRLRLWIGATLAALVVGALIATAITLSQRDDVALLGRGEVARLLAGIPQEGLRLGQPNAPVTVTVLGDIGCPRCREQTLSTLAPLLEEAVPEGRVKLVYRHWNLLGPDTARGAKASLIAAEQDRYWNYLLLLLLNQNVRTEWTELELVLPAIAREAGLDMDKWLPAGDDWQRPEWELHFTRSALLARAADIPTPPGVLVDGPRGESAMGGEVAAEHIREAVAAALTGARFDPDAYADPPVEPLPPGSREDRGDEPDHYAPRDPLFD